MSFKDDLAAAKAAAVEPVLVDVAVGEALYRVEVVKLPGMQWAEVVAAAPPSDEMGARLGYDTVKAALVACRKYSRLLDSDGEPVAEVDWRDLFDAISGVEIQAIAATWWALNVGDPNERVVALKKALKGGTAIS